MSDGASYPYETRLNVLWPSATDRVSTGSGQLACGSADLPPELTEARRLSLHCYLPKEVASRESRTAMVRTALAFLALGAAPCGRAAAQDVPLVIEHVAVIDVIAGRAQPDMTVEIRGTTIAALSAGRRARAPRHARVIDGSGEYLIPGLWDMHVHVSWPPGAARVVLPVMVANGILGARDMHGTLDAIVALKRAVARGSPIGPRLFVAGPALDGPNSYLPAARVLRTADEAREAVRQLKAGGVDFIKVYSSLPKDVYFAVATEAKSEGIPFVGHVPYAVTAAEASDAGQRSMEHLTEVDVGTSSEEVKIKARQGRGKAVRVFDLDHASPPVGRAEAVRDRKPAGDLALPETGGMQGLERVRERAGVERHHGDLDGAGQEGPHDDAVGGRVRPQHGEGIAVLSGDEGLDGFAGKAHERRSRSGAGGTRRSGSVAPPARRGSGTGPCRGWSRARGR